MAVIKVRKLKGEALALLLDKYIRGVEGEIEIDFIENFDEDFKTRRHCYWYGGCMVEIKYMGYRFCIEACGDMYAVLEDKNGQEIVRVKDGMQSGKFYDEMHLYFDTDEQLNKLLEGNPLQGGIADGAKLFVDYNNWWEAFVIDPQTGESIMSLCLDSNDLFEAVQELVELCDGSEFVDRQ